MILDTITYLQGRFDLKSSRTSLSFNFKIFPYQIAFLKLKRERERERGRERERERRKESKNLTRMIIYPYMNQLSRDHPT